MQTDAITARLTEIFQDVFMRDDIVLRPEMTAANIEGWDSFRQIEIILTCEERFGIKTTTRDLDTLRSVGDLIALIARKSPA